MIPLFLAAARDGEPATVFGDGTQTRDFTFVDDVVMANILAASRPADIASGQVTNVGAARRTSLLDLIQTIARVSGRPLEPSLEAPREGDVQHSLASLDRAARVLDYHPTVSLEDGLRRTWEWLNDAKPQAAALPRARLNGHSTVAEAPIPRAADKVQARQA